MFFFQIPLFAYMLVVYNALVLIPETPEAILSSNVFSVNMLSGAHLSLSVSGFLLLIGVFLLYIEIIKATRSTTASVLDHAFSMLVFVVFLVELLAVKAVGSQTFLILTCMALFDVIAGFTVTISTARRDIAVGHGGL
ncbi:MAG: hypothetical protein Q9N68_06050 [Gammaproteobacteria bacterium]|nr:hypothetical protein [Gammaproteobacteria bacterium]